MAKHSSGNWVYDPETFTLRVPGGRHIAYFGPHHTPDGEYPAACAIEDHANGLLCGAAPNLLESCKALLVIVHHLRNRLANYEPDANEPGKLVNPDDISVTDMAAFAIAAAGEVRS